MGHEQHIDRALGICSNKDSKNSSNEEMKRKDAVKQFCLEFPKTTRSLSYYFKTKTEAIFNMTSGNKELKVTIKMKSSSLYKEISSTLQKIYMDTANKTLAELHSNDLSLLDNLNKNLVEEKNGLTDMVNGIVKKITEFVNSEELIKYERKEGDETTTYVIKSNVIDKYLKSSADEEYMREKSLTEKDTP